jgi:hypothetical protein
MSKIGSALDAVVTRIASINGTGGYTYDFSGAAAVRRSRWSPDMQQFPLACVAAADNAVSAEPGPDLGGFTWTLQVEVIATVRPSAQTVEASEEAAAALLSDLVIALGSEPTLGGLVEDIAFNAGMLSGDQVGAVGAAIAWVTLALTWTSFPTAGV